MDRVTELRKAAMTAHSKETRSALTWAVKKVS